MGRNYYCEYCDKRFKDDANIRQKHMNGWAHQTARKEHYAKYRSPRETLEDELQKKSCSWFQSGYCQFGLNCRSSHYSQEQLDELRRQVDHEQWLKSQPKQFSVDMVEQFMANRRKKHHNERQEKLQQFFQYPETLLTKQHELPPSLRLIEPDDVMATANNGQWG